jgi:hypothetical protein
MGHLLREPDGIDAPAAKRVVICASHQAAAVIQKHVDILFGHAKRLILRMHTELRIRLGAHACAVVVSQQGFLMECALTLVKSFARGLFGL